MTGFGYNVLGFGVSGDGIQPAIASIQQVEITIADPATSNTATISSVTTTQTTIIPLGNTCDVAGNTCEARLTLTNATTVTANRDITETGSDVVVRGMVVEWTSQYVENVEYGTVSIADTASSGTDTPTGTFDGDSLVIHLGNTIDNLPTPGFVDRHARLELTNSTTVTARRGGASNGLTVSYCAVKFRANVIESVQEAVVTIANPDNTDTATITSVDTSNTLMLWGGMELTGSVTERHMATVRLTNGTTITGDRDDGTQTTEVMVTAVEFIEGEVTSAQRNRVTFGAGNTTADDTVTSVDTDITLLSYLGVETPNTTETNSYTRLSLENSTTVRGTRTVSGGATIYSYDLIEMT